jgi:hypothetical protein
MKAWSHQKHELNLRPEPSASIKLLHAPGEIASTPNQRYSLVPIYTPIYELPADTVVEEGKPEQSAIEDDRLVHWVGIGDWKGPVKS